MAVPSDFEANRDVHYAAIRKPLDPAAFVAELQAGLRGALGRLEEALWNGSAGGVQVTARRGEPWIRVPAIAKVGEPPTLDAVKAEVERRWGTLHLLQSALVHVNTLLLQAFCSSPGGSAGSPRRTCGRSRRCSGRT